MEKGRLLVCVLALTASVIAACESLKIAAFNVQVFGQKKFARAEVVAVLSQIVHRYDIILIQEIRDVSETIIYDFTNIVNNGSSEVYGVVVSERLGRSNTKEQYAFLYRLAVVEVVEMYQHNDTDDVFEREPFSVLIRTTAEDEEFFLMGIHVRPDDVVQEIEALGPAFLLASQIYGSSRGVIMGDMNAGCSYLSRRRYQELSLVNDPSFIWLLGYDADTNVARSSCPYDRFIVHKALNSSVVVESAAVFNFTEEYSLSAGQTANVSDHYPIEFQLQFQGKQSTFSVSYSTPSVSYSTPSASQIPTPFPESPSHATQGHTPNVALLLTAVVMATTKHL